MRTIDRKKMKLMLWMGVGAPIAIASVGTYAAINVPVTRRTPAIGTCQVYSGTPYVNSAQQLQCDQLTCTYVCPIVNDTTAPTASATSLTVNGWPGATNGVTAYACVIYAGGNGGICGLPSGATAQNTTLTVTDRTKWASYPNDYAYVKVDLAAGSNFWGMTYATTFVIP